VSGRRYKQNRRVITRIRRTELAEQDVQKGIGDKGQAEAEHDRD
jgi:hypothetical protein